MPVNADTFCGIRFLACAPLLCRYCAGLVGTNPDNAPATAASEVHQLAGVLGFLAVIAAMFVLPCGGRWPRRSPCAWLA